MIHKLEDPNDPHALNYLLIPAQTLGRKIVSFFSHLRLPDTGDKLDSEKQSLWLSGFNHIFIPFPRPPKKSKVVDMMHLSGSKPPQKVQEENNSGEARFEVLNAGSIKPQPKEKNKKHGVSASQDAGEMHATPPQGAKQDYRAAYLEKQKKMQEAQNARNKAAAEAQAKQKNNDGQEQNERNRAAALAQEINNWKAKSGTGECDEGTVTGNLANLESQYNSIDPKYRP